MLKKPNYNLHLKVYVETLFSSESYKPLALTFSTQTNHNRKYTSAILPRQTPEDNFCVKAVCSVTPEETLFVVCKYIYILFMYDYCDMYSIIAWWTTLGT